MDKEQVHKLTMPQLDLYLKHCREDFKFQFETSSNSILYAVSQIFGGEKKEGDDGEYKEATEEDIDMFARILGGF